MIFTNRPKSLINKTRSRQEHKKMAKQSRKKQRA